MIVAPKRCAVYCRVSSDEHLDQSFNSLDAQKDAGLAYVHIPVDGPEALTRGAAYALHQVLLTSPPTVLVHCASGNRAGALIALADAWFGSRNAESALALGRDAGLSALEPTVRALLHVRS